MTFTEKTRIGTIYKNEAARGIIMRRIPALHTTAPHIASLFKSLSLDQYYQFNQEELSQSNWIAETLSELADIPYEGLSGEQEPETIPSADYEPAGVPSASAVVQAPALAEQWGVYEVELKGPSHGNPFTEVSLHAEFSSGGKIVRMGDSTTEMGYTAFASCRISRVTGSSVHPAMRGRSMGLKEYSGAWSLPQATTALCV